MLVKPNWEIFKAKFSENPQENFEWFCYLLFSKEYNQPYGTHRYKNQSGIETDPIEFNGEVIGWQSKFYEDTLSTHKKDLLGTLTKTKRDNPNITKIILYTNSEWAQGRDEKEPQAKIDTEKKADELNIELIWRTRSYFESPFVCQEQREVSRYFFESDTKWELTNNGFKDTLRYCYLKNFKTISLLDEKKKRVSDIFVNLAIVKKKKEEQKDISRYFFELDNIFYDFLDILKKRYKKNFNDDYYSLDRNNLLLETELKMPSEIISKINYKKNRKIEIDKMLDISNKSLIITKEDLIKKKFHKYIAYLWAKEEIYQEFEYLIYLSLSKWSDGGLKSLIRANFYYSLDDELITFDIKENNQRILFLFDDFDRLNSDKKENLLNEISQFNLKYYIFITNNKKIFSNKFDFNEYFDINFLRLDNFIKKEDNYSYKNKVFDYISNEFKKHDSDYIITKDKELYSKEIEEYITFDIVLEAFNPSKSLIIVKYFEESQNISLRDIKEFYMKREEVKASSVIIVSFEEFDKKIINYAEDNSIGLISYNDINSKWIRHRSLSTFNNIHSYSFATFIKIFLDKQLYKESVISKDKSKEKTLKVKFLKEEDINKTINILLNNINYKQGRVDLEKIIDLLKKKNNLKIFYNQALSKGVLGEIDFEKNTIYIDNYQCETLARVRFTIAHEIGHYILGHSKYMYREKYTIALNEEFGKKISNNSKEIRKMEYQANKFASLLLLPLNSFYIDIVLLLKEYKVKNKGFGILYLDNQNCNTTIFMKITSRLMHKYKVSRKVISIRLEELNILKISGRSRNMII